MAIHRKKPGRMSLPNQAVMTSRDNILRDELLMNGEMLDNDSNISLANADGDAAEEVPESSSRPLRNHWRSLDTVRPNSSLPFLQLG